MVDGIFWNNEQILNDNISLLSSFNEYSFSERKELNVQLIGVEGEIDVASQIFERPLFEMREYVIELLVSGNLESLINRLINKFYNESGFQRLRFNNDESLFYLAKTFGKPMISKINDKNATVKITVKTLPKRVREISSRLRPNESAVPTDLIFVKTEVFVTKIPQSYELLVPKHCTKIEILNNGLPINSLNWNGLTRTFTNGTCTITTRLNQTSEFTLVTTDSGTLNIVYYVEVL